MEGLNAPGLALNGKKDGLGVGGVGVGARGRLGSRFVNSGLDSGTFFVGHYTDARPSSVFG